jgi:hypothetical protein
MADFFNKLTVLRGNNFNCLDHELSKIKIMNKEGVINSISNKDFENNCSSLVEKLDNFVEYYKNNPDPNNQRRYFRANNSLYRNKSFYLTRFSGSKYKVNSHTKSFSYRQDTNTTNVTSTETPLITNSQISSVKKHLKFNDPDYSYKIPNRRLDALNKYFKKETKVKDLLKEFKNIKAPSLEKKNGSMCFERKEAFTDEPRKAKSGVKFIKYMDVKAKVTNSESRLKPVSFLFKKPLCEKALKIRQFCQEGLKKAELSVKRFVSSNQKIHDDTRKNLNTAIKGKEIDIVKRIVYEESIEYKKRSQFEFIYEQEGYKWENKDRLFSNKYKIKMQDYK